MTVAWYWWAAFVVAVLVMLAIDLFVAHRKPHKVSSKEAATWSAIWITLGLVFGAAVWLVRGGQAGQEYLTAYLIEKSLSVDNLFVFVLIFSFFRVPAAYQHRVLFYGVLGAFVFRGIFIALGAVLLSKFSWIAFLFGAILIYTAWKVGTHQAGDVHPEDNPVLKFLRRHLPMTPDFHGQKIFLYQGGKVLLTPLFAVLVVIETTDVLFAVDSIPAAFGVTRDPFLIFTSNAFALLGLRSLYFLLADLVQKFRYLDSALAIILGIVGVKLVYEEFVHMHDQGHAPWLPDALVVHIPPWAPLVLVAVVLIGAIWLSIRKGRASTPSAGLVREVDDALGVEHARPGGRSPERIRSWHREPSLGARSEERKKAG